MAKFRAAHPIGKAAGKKAAAWRKAHPAKAKKTAAKYPYSPKSSIKGQSMGKRLAAAKKAAKGKGARKQPYVRSVSQMRFLYAKGVTFQQPAHGGRVHGPEAKRSKERLRLSRKR